MIVTSATIRDVARRAGVGVGTVSRVLNDSAAVSESTRHKVLSAIEALNYTPNPMARRLSLGKTLTIGVIAPFFTRPSVVERLRGIEYVLGESEYDLIVFNVEASDKPESYLRSFPRRERVDGLLIISLFPDEENVERLSRANTPVVLIDVSHPAFPRVRVDDVAGGRQATEHLLSLGHRKLGFICDYADPGFSFTANQQRFEGFHQALLKAGVPFPEEYRLSGEHSRSSAFEMTRQLLRLSDPPTAIFATSDTLAIGVLEAAQQLGVQVPAELSVIGYDDIEIAEYLRLTTIHQSLFESGLEGSQMLLREIDGLPISSRDRVLPTELIVRDTTGPAPLS